MQTFRLFINFLQRKCSLEGLSGEAGKPRKAGTVDYLDTTSNSAEAGKFILPARYAEFVRVGQQSMVAVPVGAVTY